MNSILSFLQEVGTFYLATCDAGDPRVRPFGFVMEHDGKLVFCTCTEIDVFKQLKTNPKVEICATSADRKVIRLTGRVDFITTKELQEKALETAPVLKNIYSVGDGKLELFSLDEGFATITEADGTQTREKLYP